MSDNANRVPSGVPTGGQFSTRARREARVSLGTPPAPSADFEALVTHEDASVRAAMAANASMPDDVLERLAVDEAASVRAGVLRNPNASPDLVKRIADESLPVDLFDNGGGEEAKVWFALAQSPNADAESLDRLAEKKYRLGNETTTILTAVAYNRNTSPETLAKLMGNDRAVSEAAHYALSHYRF